MRLLVMGRAIRQTRRWSALSRSNATPGSTCRAAGARSPHQLVGDLLVTVHVLAQHRKPCVAHQVASPQPWEGADRRGSDPLRGPRNARWGVGRNCGLPADWAEFL